MLKQLDDKILQWVVYHKFKNSSGQPFEWKEHRFLLQPLIDFSPTQGINKSAQIGGSEMMILKTLYLAIEEKLNIIYTLPSDSFVQKFVTPKVDVILENNPVLLENSEGGIYLKKFNEKPDERFIYFLGAHNTAAEANKEEGTKGISITADVIVNDEASRSNQFVLQQLKSRLANSLFKFRWLMDNPTYPGMGADGIYQKSDQQHWFVRCSHCNYPQYLQWARLDKEEWRSGTNHTFIDPVKKIFVCGKCRKEITDADRLAGFWVPKYSSRVDIRGYWMSQMCYVRHNVKSILETEEDEKSPKSYFFNYVLGLPYIGNDIQLSRQNVIGNTNGEVNLLNDNAMGVDQGQIKWYVIGNKQGIFKYGYTESWDEIEKLRNQYNAKMVVDALPYTGPTKNLAEKYPGYVWRAFYSHQKDTGPLALFSPKDNPHIVLIKRDEMFDVIVDKITNNKMPINIKEADLDLLINHLTAIVRVVERDSEGNDRFYWDAIKPDHLAHALLYFNIAMMQTGGTGTVIKPRTYADLNKLEAIEVTNQDTMTQDIFDLITNY